MSLWADALGAMAVSLVADDATYRVGGIGAGSVIRVWPVETTDEVKAGIVRVATPLQQLDVRVSEIAAPAAGDTVEWQGQVWKVGANPLRHANGLLWRLECTR